MIHHLVTSLTLQARVCVSCRRSSLCFVPPARKLSFDKEGYLDWVGSVNRALAFFQEHAHYKGVDKAVRKLVGTCVLAPWLA